MRCAKENRIRVGLVGAGYVSAYHIRALQSLGYLEIVGIADLDRECAQRIAVRFGIPGVYNTLAEMVSARPEVIHVLTPPASHCGLTLEALDMGCHVFVEKPMAPTLEECDRMIARARESGRVLSVNHSARMDPVVLRALDLVRAGACGDLLGVDFFRSSDYPPYAGGPLPPPFRNGAYPFQDLGVHGLCLLEAFLGTIRGVDVRYFSTGRDPLLLVDEWRVLAECEKGTGQMYLSWNARPMRNELLIHGTRGSIHVDCFLQTCVLRRVLPAPKSVQAILNAGTASLYTLWRVAANCIRFAAGKLLPSPGIHVSVREFYRSLSRGTAPPISAEEGRRIVAWMEGACRKADAEKQRRLPRATEPPPCRILVTGASGFLGAALLKRLRQRGEAVRLLLRRPSPSLEADPRLHVVYGDLGDPEAVDLAVNGVETVYHVGATMHGSAADFERGTVAGTRNIVFACLRHGAKRLVYVSSIAVLDHAGHRRGILVNESYPLEPHPDRRGFYTQTKLEAERIVLEAIHNRNLPAVILRPGQIFGPGAQKVPPSGAIAIAGRWLVVGSGQLPVPLVYVEDVVDALLLAAEREGVCGSIFHLVDPDTVTQKEYVEICRTALKPELRVSYIPQPALYAPATAIEIAGHLTRRRMPLSRYRLRSIRPLSDFDSSAAVKILCWTPKVGVRQGLKLTFGLAGAASRDPLVRVGGCTEGLYTRCQH